ncbi:MAG: hypothetical protein MI923_08325 [Phycisphaerales bacterium]|nr:hypothetical protein [Phycisphaerales bacterium]
MSPSQFLLARSKPNLLSGSIYRFFQWILEFASKLGLQRFSKSHLST